MFDALKRIVRAGRGVFFARPESNQTLAHIFEQHARKRGAKTFLLYADREYSYGDANRLVNRHAHAYKALGLKQGDVVALLMENRPEFLWHVLAAGKLGITISLINNNNSGKPLAHSLNICKPQLIVIGSELLASFQDVRGEIECTSVYVDSDPDTSAPAASDLPSWKMRLEGTADTDPPETSQQKLGDLMAYIYTSGTTGLPKAALVRGLRIYGIALGVGNLGWQLNENDIVYNALPLYHTNGIGVCTGSVINFGATMALSRRFSASRFWSDIRRYDATAFIYIGELCRYLLNVPPSDGDKQHKVRAICGNGLRPDIWVPFQERFAIPRIAEFYGSTEGNIGTLNMDNTVGSVGTLLFGGALVKYDDKTDDFVRGPDGFLVKCKTNEPGVLLGKISKRLRFDGYQDEKATNSKIVRDAFKKGDAWFNTGDLLRMDSKRRLFFVDRMGDTFRWKGENVSTFEVQEQLSSWPVAKETNVYGVQIEGTEGRAGMASLVLDETAAFDASSFKHHVDSNLPGYARPLFVRVRKELDTTGTFKLKKQELRDEGFDPKRVADPLYFRHPEQDEYVELTAQLYEDVIKGRLRL